MSEWIDYRDEITDLIREFGNTITVVKRVDTDDIDEWGQPVFADNKGKTYHGVMYNNLPVNLLTAQSTQLSDGQTIMIVNADSDIIPNDEILFDGKTYKVLSIEDYIVANVKIYSSLKLGRA
jgi:hypothetical protein